MKILKYIPFALLFILAGCQLVYEHSEDKLRDAKLTRKIAENGIPLARIKIGFIKGIWYGRIDELPGQIQEIMEEYLRASADPNSLTDEQAGYVIGLEMRIDEIVFRKFLSENFPELLRYLP